jgi:hypothetical protein
MDGDYGVRESRPESHVMLLTDVSTGDFLCWEQVVFDFEDELGAPDGAISYRVEYAYASPPFVGTSGLPIHVAGRRFLRVTFYGARTADINSVPIRETYTGPDEIVPTDLEWVQEIQLVEDFEAVMVWVIGLDTGRDFRVQQLDGPDRLVIDIGPPV